MGAIDHCVHIECHIQGTCKLKGKYIYDEYTVKMRVFISPRSITIAFSYSVVFWLSCESVRVCVMGGG